jgi:hypothetical protein
VKRAPTAKQAGRLRILGSGAIVLAPGRGEWGPLLRRGWVEPTSDDDRSKRFLPPLRITADGLRALADAVDAHPELRPEIKRRDFEQFNEHPRVTTLKAAVEKARQERDEAQREARAFRTRLRAVRRALGDTEGGES